MNISKQELLENYYMDEFLTVLDKYNEMHKYEPNEEKAVPTHAEDL